MFSDIILCAVLFGGGDGIYPGSLSNSSRLASLVGQLGVIGPTCMMS